MLHHCSESSVLQRAVAESAVHRSPAGNSVVVAVHLESILHELAHELLHDAHSRLDPRTKALHEHEAEATAAVVLGYCGHPVSVSASYLRRWGATPADVVRSMDRIAGAAAEIVRFIEGQQGKGHCGPQEGHSTTESCPGVHGCLAVVAGLQRAFSPPGDAPGGAMFCLIPTSLAQSRR